MYTIISVIFNSLYDLTQNLIDILIPVSCKEQFHMLKNQYTSELKRFISTFAKTFFILHKQVAVSNETL